MALRVRSRFANFRRHLSIALNQKHYRKVMDQPADLHDFWRQPAPDGNVPSEYINQTHRSAALLKLVAGEVSPGASILEVGCNVGRNLAALKNAGYSVEGVEISPHAVKLLRETYPELSDSAVHVGPAEETIPAKRFDLVFTMAVLEHIHPDSSVVFDKMAGATDCILAIEPTFHHSSHRQFPHDIPALFKARGFRLVSATKMSEFPETASDPVFHYYTAHLFRR